MSAFDDENDAGKVGRYGRVGARGGGTPGRATLTSRIPASARAIARAVMAEMNGVAHDADASVARAAASSGHALPAELRDRFESSLGTDLGGVRVHTDAAAANAAQAVSARAFAIGGDVHFAAGAYDPGSHDGQLLIAHEVAHTVQQRGAAPGAQCKLEVSEPGDALECEADAAMTAMVAGAPAQVSAGAMARISRWADPGAARPLLDLIAHGDRAQLQAIILALETARAEQVASGVPARIAVAGGWASTVDAHDLDPLEQEARRRWRALSEERDHSGGDDDGPGSGGVQASGIFDRLRGRSSPPPVTTTPLAAQRAVAQRYLSDVGTTESQLETSLQLVEDRAAAYNRALTEHQRAMQTPQGDDGEGVIRAQRELELARDELRELGERAGSLQRGARGDTIPSEGAPGGSETLTRADEIVADLGAEEAALAGDAPQSTVSSAVEARVRAAEARLEAARTRIAEGVRAANQALETANGVRTQIPRLTLSARNRGGGGNGGPGSAPPPAGPSGPGAPGNPGGPGNRAAAAEPVVEGPPVEGAPVEIGPTQGVTPPRTTTPVVEEPTVPPSMRGRVTMNGAGRFSGGLNAAMGVANVAGVVMMAIDMARPHYDMYALPAGTRVWGLQGFIFRSRVEGTIVVEGTRHYVRWDNGRTTEIEPQPFDPNTVT